MQPKPRNRLKTIKPVPKEDARSTWNDSRSVAKADFFTIGYSGRKIDELLEALTTSGVRSLIDIRCNPVSMHRPEMSKSNLKRRVEESGMQYFHLPELGVPRDIRSKAIDEIWDWYDTHSVEPFIGNDLDRYRNWVVSQFEFLKP